MALVYENKDKTHESTSLQGIKLMRIKTIMLFVMLLSGCMQQTYENLENHDPNEKTLNGTVIKKVKPSLESEAIRNKELERQGASDTYLGTLLAIGTGTIILPHEERFGVEGGAIEYYVSLETGKILRIYNHFTGFSIGECVRVFISENWKKYPPRMALGGECSKEK